MALSDQQIAGAAKAAGFTGGNLATAVAVALAESSGDPNATNKNSNGSTDYGLWQINSVHGPLLKEGNWANPTDNAKMAFKVSGGGVSWSPWTTYKSGAYKKFANRAQLAAGAPVDPGPGGSGSTSATGSALDPTAGLSFFTNTGMWARVGIYILGAVLLLFAVWKLTGIGDAAVSAVKGVVSARTGGLVKL